MPCKFEREEEREIEIYNFSIDYYTYMLVSSLQYLTFIKFDVFLTNYDAQHYILFFAYISAKKAPTYH